MQPSFRISNQKPYFFSTLNSYIHSLQASGRDIIRLDIGSPDLPPEDRIIEALVEALNEPGAHGYSPYGGIPEFRQAVSQFYSARFGVQLDPQEEVVGLIGSKEGVFNLAQALLDPSDLALVPEPAYPSYAACSLAAGGRIYRLRLTQDFGFLPDFSEIPETVAQEAKILWLNYPNNPTGAVADLAFFQTAVDFARNHQLVIVHDAPYMEVSYDGYSPPSLLQIPDAKEISVELNSLSKAYNMAGWRLGMAVGNSEVLSCLHRMKLKVDTANFKPLQVAGAEALAGDQGWVQDRNAIYQRRRDILLAALQETSLVAERPQAALYIWARLPEGVDDHDFCRRLLDDTGVSITPGSVFGEFGAGYVRVSVCTPEARIQEAIARLLDWI